MRTTLRLDLPSVNSVRAVYTALQGIEGIARADVSLGRAIIDHDGRATAEKLRDAVGNAGYQVLEILEERRSLNVKEVEEVQDVQDVDDPPRQPRRP
jgi:copper chaperone CopZ